jgi:hypothetical protein
MEHNSGDNNDSNKDDNKNRGNDAAPSNEDNLKLVPGAAKKKHGLHRTKPELRDKLDAFQGKNQAKKVEAMEEGKLELVPGAVAVNNVDPGLGTHQSRSHSVS